MEPHAAILARGRLFLLAASLAATATGLQAPPLPALWRTPRYNTSTLGGMTFAHVTKATWFNSSDLAFLRKFPIVQFDKSTLTESMASALRRTAS